LRSWTLALIILALALTGCSRPDPVYMLVWTRTATEAQASDVKTWVLSQDIHIEDTLFIAPATDYDPESDGGWIAAEIFAKRDDAEEARTAIGRAGFKGEIIVTRLRPPEGYWMKPPL
jgi:hypothetical protein